MKIKKKYKKNTIFKVITTLIPFLILIVFFGINNVFAIKDQYNIEINSSKGIISEKELVAEVGDIVNCQVQLEADYSLYTMNILDDKGNSIDYNYDNNMLTFKMPKSDINIQIVAVKQLFDGVYISVSTKEDMVYGYDTFEMGNIELINTLAEPIELESTNFVNNNIYDYNSSLLQNYVVMPTSKTDINFNLKAGLQSGEYSDLFQFVIKHKDEVSGVDLTEQFKEKIDIIVKQVVVTELPQVNLSIIKEGQSLKDVNLTYDEIPYGNLIWEDENACPIEGTVISPMLINIEDTINYDFSFLKQYFISDNQMRFYVNVEVVKEEPTTQEMSKSEQITVNSETNTAKNDNIIKSLENVTEKETQTIKDNITKSVESLTNKETQSINDSTTKSVENVTEKEVHTTKENVTEKETQSTKYNTDKVGERQVEKEIESTKTEENIVVSETQKEIETIVNKEETIEKTEQIITDNEKMQADIIKSEEINADVLKTKNIMVSVPSEISLFVDPYKSSSDTSIYSSYVKFENISEDKVNIDIINFQVNVKKQSVTDEPSCILYLVDNNGNKYKLNNGNNTKVFSMELDGVDSNNNLLGFYIQGDITHGNFDGWSDSDIEISILYNIY